MSCMVVMDLKPIDSKFTFSKKGKSATLMCSFTGKYKSEHSVQVELLVTNRSGNRFLKDNVSRIQADIASGSLLRVTGAMRRMLYQDRDSGHEIDRLRVYAFDVANIANADPTKHTCVLDEHDELRPPVEAPVKLALVGILKSNGIAADFTPDEQIIVSWGQTSDGKEAGQI